MTMYSAGDEGIQFSFHKIVVLPDELVKATTSLMGKGLIVYRNMAAWDDKVKDPVMMVQVVDDMKRIEERFDADGGNVRHYYIYDYLHTKLVKSPLVMAELIETENIKLLEECREQKERP
jgi:hypothetical protein